MTRKPPTPKTSTVATPKPTLQQQLTQAKAERAESESKYQQELTALASQLSLVQQQLTAQESQNATLQSELKQQLQTVETSLMQAQSELTQKTAQIQALQSTLQQQQEAHKQELAQQESQYASLRSEWEKQLHNLQIALAEKTTQADSWQTHIAQQKEDYENYQQAVERHNLAQQDQLRILQASLTQKIAEIAALEQQRLFQQEAFANLEGSLRLEFALAQQEAWYESESLRHRLDLANQQIAKLKAEGDRLQQEYNLLSRQLLEQRALAEIGSSAVNRWRHRSIG